MRKNIFDLLNNSKIDIHREYKRIRKLFEKTPYYYSNSIKEYINNNQFLKWKYRGRYLSITEVMSDLEITEQHFNCDVSIEKLVLYIEFVINMISLIPQSTYDEHNRVKIKTLKENIDNLLEDLNYKIYHNKAEQYIVIEKDIITTAVAETMPEICNNVIEYRRVILKGNIEEKRTILKNLSNIIEPLKNKFKSTEYKNMIEDVNFLLNNLNIKNNNLEGNKRKEYTVNMSCEDLEKWYDRTYDAILGLIIVDKYVDLKHELKELKNHYKSC